MSSVTIALVSFLGVVVGAGLQYLFTRVLEERRHHRDLKTQAYSDYIRSVCEVRHMLIQPQASREREMLARLTDAKARVCLYGSDFAILKLSEFESLGGQIKTGEQQDAFVEVLIAMRGETDVKAKELRAVMLGNK